MLDDKDLSIGFRGTSHSRMALVGIKLTKPVQIYNSIYTAKKEKVVQRDAIFHTNKVRSQKKSHALMRLFK